MGKKYILSSIVLFAAIALSANCIIKSKYKRTYCSSGVLESVGWYIMDSVPGHSSSHFYKNGKLYMETRDDSGNLNGIAKIYYKNGKLNQLQYYVNNLRQGFIYDYFENGKLRGRIFCLNDKQTGDGYLYDERGHINRYWFLDFLGRNRNLMKWDKAGNMIEDLCPVIFIDSTRSYNEPVDKDNEYSYDVMVIIANRPKCRTSVKIDYISKNGITMKSDSSIGKPYYFSKDRFFDSLHLIKFFGSEYDSTNQKTTYQRSETELVGGD